ncbi:MAG: putative lipoprotein, partial [Bradymonadia bacterium]
MRSWMSCTFFGLIGLCGLASCDDDSGATGPPRTVPTEPEAAEPSQPGTTTFLESLAEQVISPLYAKLQTDMTALKAALDDWLGSPGDVEVLDAARAAYQTAMDSWQRAEVMQIGPASTGRTGSLRLRDPIYSWPQVNACRVDQEVAKGTSEGVNLAETRLVNVYGFDALEYLLFYSDERNQCPPQVPPNSDGAWNGMDADGVQAARATYAVAVGGQLVRDIDALSAEWTSYKTELITAGNGSTLYASRQDAYNDVFAAIFYLDIMVKDAKVGDVVGITAGCAEDRCPENAESEWLGRDGRNVLENLRGAELVLFGTGADDSKGFVVLLEDRG